MYKNIAWDLLGKFGTQIVSFILSIILTRFLTPTEYGIMGMVMVVVTVAHIFLDLGFNRAIIQRPDVSQTQYSTIFYINAGMALLLATICFFSAGALAHFYNQPLIQPVFKVASLSFLINGLNLIPSSILYKKLRFKVNSIQSLISAILSGVVGVVMAYKGFGVWSLVTQSLLGSFTLLVLNWFYVRWWPSLQFSIAAIRPMWAYGSRLFASGMLDTVYNRMDTFIIGKIFSPTTLGYYARAQGMDNMVRQFSAGSIMGSLFPYIAKHQDDRNLLKELYKKYLHIILFVSVGISGGLFLVAKDLFTFLFTARWLYAAELFQILAIMGFAWPISCLMCIVISGVGNSKAYFKLELIKKGVTLPTYLFGFLLGLKGFLLLFCLATFVSVGVNAFYVSKEVNWTTPGQLRIVAAYVLSGLLACTAAYFLSSTWVQESLLLNMCSTGAAFALIYTGVAYLLKLEGANVISVGVKKIKSAFK